MSNFVCVGVYYCHLRKQHYSYYSTNMLYLGLWIVPRNHHLLWSKETVRGGRVAEMSAHSIQCCDWLTWRRAARSANHSTESSGPTFRLLFLLSWSPWIHPRRPERGGRVVKIWAFSNECWDCPTWQSNQLLISTFDISTFLHIHMTFHCLIFPSII